MPSDPPSVFISYSHDSPEHRERVLVLSDRLRSHGVDANLDQYVESPPKGWQLWMEDEIEAADFVLVVATGTYEKRRRGNEAEGKGLGVYREGAIVSQAIYEARQNVRFVPVVFDAADEAHIPVFLKSATSYNVSDDAGYESLLRRLTGQPKVVKGPLGPRPSGLSPRPGSPPRPVSPVGSATPASRDSTLRPE